MHGLLHSSQRCAVSAGVTFKYPRYDEAAIQGSELSVCPLVFSAGRVWGPSQPSINAAVGTGGGCLPLWYVQRGLCPFTPTLQVCATAFRMGWVPFVPSKKVTTQGSAQNVP